MRWLHRLAAAVLTVLVVGLAAAVVAILTGQVRVLPLLSGSMAPYLETGDAALLRPKPRSELAQGDILVFSRPTEPADAPPTIHRVIALGVDDDGTPVATTKGDNNNAVDPWALRIEDDVVWTARASLTNLGWAVWKTREPITWFVIIGLAGLAIIGWGLWSIWAPVPDEDEWIEEQLSLRLSDPLTAALVRRELARRRSAGRPS